MAAQEAFRPRERCMRCRRPHSVCYCAALPRLETSTRVLILQHPRERDVPIGTARMATLCLPTAELHVGTRWDDSSVLASALSDPARPAILLYPGAGARDILAAPPAGPVTLVVVDGTWSQAKTLVRDNPILQALPHYAFATPEPSHYRIRREPRAEYCSTIEALMHVLGVLEGDPARFRALLDPFHAMVDAQLAAQAARPLRRVRVPRPPTPQRERLPSALRERFDDLVCVVGEANAWPYRKGVGDEHDATKPADELVHLVALRPASGKLFDMIAAPTGELAPSTGFHCGIANERLLAGHPRANVVDAFARFLRPTDVFAAWGYYSADLVRASAGTIGEQLDLRGVAQRLLHRRIGGLEEFAATIGAPSPPLAEGRAGRRLAALAQIVTAWRTL